MLGVSLRPLAALALCAALSPAAWAQDVPANDNLNAVLWMQRSVEYQATTLALFELAKIRLDQALKDKSWTAAPAEQTGDFKDLTPAIVIDADETVLDNSGYQAWMVMNNLTFSPKTWTQFVNSQTSLATPGAVEFAKYAEAKGVRVFYVTNRTKVEEGPTRENMRKLGFPMSANVDTILSAKEQPDWSSAKGTRRAAIARHYRILLCIGDNFGDFTDAYKGSVEERQTVFEENHARWGREWIMLPNPSYGSFESAPFGGNFKLPVEEQRAAKRAVLAPWNGQ
ncbi:5'-nucleotidase, lipoprotein e(P4) family [Dongia deserti]|uniref:5'-nucleotidase, lipoprotein e(P4) family n=1 Tax=Dongia deserti TaxID=2268030 RepID=UPI000E64C997|nr:HAD family acid phosphatase [Dongia deserti]